MTAEIALLEVRQILSTVPLRESDYSDWLIKWTQLFHSYELPPLWDHEEHKFYDTYYHLKELKTFLSYSNSAQKAISDFNDIKTEDELSLLTWLVKNEEMHKDLGLFIYNTMCANLDENIKVIDTGKVKVDASEFKILIKFCNLYHPLYFEKLEKYKTYNEDDKIDYNSEEGDQALSLTFQLRLRNLI